MFNEVPIARCLRLAFGGSLAGLALLSTPVLAQDVQQGERVTVTGSSIKRIEGESALPVTVIRREEIDRLGVVSAAELLERIAANNGGGYNATLALGDAGRPGFQGASLHGLGSTNTLLLLNGRRLAVFAFDGGGASLTNIPLAAIERVEVLRDGASAIYGADAIAGVINFITRKDFTGAVLDTSYYSTDNHGGNYGNATGTFGYGDLATQGFNIFGSADYRKQGAISASDRSYANTAYLPNLGINRLSSNAVPANISTSGGLVNPYSPRNVGVANSCAPPASFGTSATDARCRYDFASVIDIYNPTESGSVFVRGTLQLGANNQAFVEGMHSETRQKFRISPTPASEATVFNVGQTPLLYPATGKYYPGNGITPAIPGVVIDSGGFPGYADVYLRTLSAGPRTDVSKEKFDRGLIGLEGSGYGWDYNAGLLHTRDRVTDTFTDGYLSESRLLNSGGLTPKQPGYIAAVTRPGNSLDPNLNPFSISQDPAGQAVLDRAQIRQVVRTGDSKRDSFDAHASREIYNLPAGPLALAVGGEYRREKFADIPSGIFSSGDIIGSGGDLQPVDASRRVFAGFFELNIPIIKNLEAGVAARYDHYNDFGSTTNPKVTLRYQPAPEVLLRGSIGKGFRAPTLPELFVGTTQTNSGGVYNDPLYDNSAGFRVTDPATGVGGRCDTQFNGTYCGAQLKVKQGGNSALTPEKSHQYSVGLLLEPSRDFSFGADYFYIKQRQLIGVVGADVQLQDYVNNFDPVTRTSSSQYASSIVTRFDNTTNATVIDYVGNFNQNLGVQITKGIDFSVRARLPVTSYGAITFNYDSTYLISQKNRQPSQDSFTEAVGQFIQFGPVQRYKQVFTTNWDYGPFSAAVVYNWGSGYQDFSSNRRVGANESIDILGGYTIAKSLKLGLGIKNLMDRNPPVSDQQQYFQVGYDPTIGDPHGRAYYARLTYTYK